MSITKKFHFGNIRSVPEGAEESRIIPFILSTYTKDRHGTVLNQDNWKLDNYRKNPVIAYQHNLSGGLCAEPNPDFIIGKSVSLSIDGMGKDRMLVAEAQFEPAEINPLAEKVFRKILFGSLNRSSVGFIPVGGGSYGQGEEAEGRENETFYFEGQELLEWSVVNIPSNPDAGTRDYTRRMREEGYAALMYAWKELGGRFRLSQIEEFSARNILDLLDGKEIDIKENNPDRVRELLNENGALKDRIERMNTLLEYYKNSRRGY